MIRVLLVDDDALVRAGLRLILGGSKDVEVVGESGDGAAAVETAGQLEPDVVLMDIRMPVMDGIEATRALRGRSPAPHVIVLTTFDADDLVVQALSAGASGFLLKDTRPERLIGAIHAVCAGDPFLSPSVTRQLVSKVTGATAADPRQRALLEHLTDREHEVAVLISRGLSNADIAADLYMSVPTVKAHVSRILAKLEVDNRVQAAILVHEALR